MQDSTILCPKCGTSIPLSETLKHQMKEELERDLQKKFELEKKQFEETQKRELWVKAQQAAKEKVELEIKDLRNQEKERGQQIQEMEKRELELRQQKRTLEETQRKMEIDLQRRLDTEKQKISLDAKKEKDEEYRMKMAEKDKQMEQMNKTIMDLKRQAEQGSMQVQGDTAESDLKQLLSSTFVTDIITDVPTGVRGADLIQTVRSEFGQVAGIILWESKNTKAFSQEWVKKLKDDQVLAKADMSILVTRVLPDGIKHFGNIDGILLVEPAYVHSVTHLIRNQLMNLSKMKQSMVGSEKKMEYLYKYLLSSEFKNKIENIINAFTTLKMDLETEKRAMQKIWSKREKELERVVSNTSSLYGDLQGATNESLPKISSLELSSGTSSDENAELF